MHSRMRQIDVFSDLAPLSAVIDQQDDIICLWIPKPTSPPNFHIGVCPFTPEPLHGVCNSNVKVVFGV